MDANWFIVGAGPDGLFLLPIKLSRSIFNPAPAHVDPICDGVVADEVVNKSFVLLLIGIGDKNPVLFVPRVRFFVNIDDYLMINWVSCGVNGW